MSNAFEPSRLDGRSDKQIVLEVASDMEPGDLITYDQLRDALQVGIDKPITRQRMYQSVSNGNKTLLRESKRLLQPVNGRGYRMAEARDHLTASARQRERAHNNLVKGLNILKNTRLDELSDNERNLHEGHMLVTSALCSAHDIERKKGERRDDLIADLIGRVERLEGEKE